jgi:hypothetical protein
MRVVGRISGTSCTFRDGATKQQRQDIVVFGIGLILVEREYDERAIVVEVRVA